MLGPLHQLMTGSRSVIIDTSDSDGPYRQGGIPARVRSTSSSGISEAPQKRRNPATSRRSAAGFSRFEYRRQA
jgi:hypothetical protein